MLLKSFSKIERIKNTRRYKTYISAALWLVTWFKLQCKSNGNTWLIRATAILQNWDNSDCMFLSCHVLVSVWPNGWVFVYELSGSGFESSCSHLRQFYFEKINPKSC